jgi:cytochrome c
MRYFKFAFFPALLATVMVSCDNTTAPAGLNSSSADIRETPASVTSDTAYGDRFESLPAPYSAADYSLGRRTFKMCGSCHTLTENGRDLVGPNLHGIFGRPVGAREGFGYSKALSTEDFIWTPERLESWLENPRDFLPGNRMSFAGVRRPEARHAVIAYLMTETGYQAAPETALSVPTGDRKED